MAYFVFILAAFCILLTGARGAPQVNQRQPRLEFENVAFHSIFDGKVITTTDYLEDPGPYDVYGTIAQTDEQLAEQRWGAYMYDDSTISVSPNAGQYWNTFSIYKPCPDCFAANEYWMVVRVDGEKVDVNQNPGLNTTGILISTWTELCLINPGDDYLIKGRCDVQDSRQLWNVIWTTQ